jgi:hypothetical protein
VKIPKMAVINSAFCAFSAGTAKLIIGIIALTIMIIT